SNAGRLDLLAIPSLVALARTDAIRPMWQDDETDVGRFATEMIRAAESGADIGEVAERLGTGSGLFDDLLGRMLLRALR
ncbi:MAG: hypothetical protein IID05_14840, partial [Gemmatimonadetes bacterium]|nr:hypothetical protein [Gemmatimonadota bacterium]